MSLYDATDGPTASLSLSCVSERASACDLLGVDVDDMFEPDDLLLYKNMDRGACAYVSLSAPATASHLSTCYSVALLLVYRNILALQAAAVSLSTRRSIDERSSLGTKPVRPPDVSLT